MAYNPWNNYYRKTTKWQRFLAWITPSWWHSFWYKEHWNSFGSSNYNEFKTANLAIVIAIITLIIIIGYIIFHG